MQRRESPRYAARTVALRQGLYAACPARHAPWVFALFSLLLSASGSAWAKAQPREVQLPPEMEAKVKDKDAFVKNYDAIVTDAVREALAEEPFVTPRFIIPLVGDKAQIWLDVDNGRPRIDSIMAE